MSAGCQLDNSWMSDGRQTGIHRKYLGSFDRLSPAFAGSKHVGLRRPRVWGSSPSHWTSHDIHPDFIIISYLGIQINVPTYFMLVSDLTARLPMMNSCHVQLITLDGQISFDWAESDYNIPGDPAGTHRVTSYRTSGRAASPSSTAPGAMTARRGSMTSGIPHAFSCSWCPLSAAMGTCCWMLAQQQMGGLYLPSRKGYWKWGHGWRCVYVYVCVCACVYVCGCGVYVCVWVGEGVCNVYKSGNMGVKGSVCVYVWRR